MRDRTVAILLCFFGGAFGIHKFYLGKTFEGIIYLVTSWTLIPGIFAFFEFLGLCFMSDREFNAQFNGYPSTPTLDRNTSYPVAANTRSKQEATATLYELKKLYDDEIITAEEYERKRQKMLDEI